MCILYIGETLVKRKMNNKEIEKIQKMTEEEYKEWYTKIKCYYCKSLSVESGDENGWFDFEVFLCNNPLSKFFDNSLSEFEKTDLDKCIHFIETNPSNFEK